ncbi:MAG: Hpt domain-containing protein [Bacteroidota bacterium]
MTAQDIIDPAAFAGFFDSLGGDVGFLTELVDEYLASSPGLIAGMHQALAAGDAATLQRAAHTLKSGSASFGGLAFAAQCKELEDMGKAGMLDAAPEKLAALEAAYSAVAAALQARLENARSARG